MRAILSICGMLLMLATATAVAAPVPTHLMKAPPPAYYPTVPGTILVYDREGELETRRIETVEAKDGGKLVTTVRVRADGTHAKFHKVLVNAKGVFIVEGAGQAVYRSPIEMIRLPFQPGESWAADDTNSTRKSIGEEVIKVPGGEFKCLKITSEITGARTTTHWYARGVGVVKIDYGSSTLELKSITLGK